MLGLLLYIRASGVLFDCPSAQRWRRCPAAPVRRNPGSRRAGRPERDMERLHIRVRPATLLVFLSPLSIDAAGSPFFLARGRDLARRSAFRRLDLQPRAQSTRPACAIA